MTAEARHQVVEHKRGYAVKDTRTGQIVGRTYDRLGWAIRYAIQMNEIKKSFRYT